MQGYVARLTVFCTNNDHNRTGEIFCPSGLCLHQTVKMWTTAKHSGGTKMSLAKSDAKCNNLVNGGHLCGNFYTHA